MEDDLKNKQKREDDLKKNENGRRPKFKKIKMEDDLQKKWKMSSKKNGRQPKTKWKTTSKEKWKTTYKKWNMTSSTTLKINLNRL